MRCLNDDDDQRQRRNDSIPPWEHFRARLDERALFGDDRATSLDDRIKERCVLRRIGMRTSCCEHCDGSSASAESTAVRLRVNPTSAA